MTRTWLPIEIALAGHRKTKALARLWHCHPYMVVGFLVSLWGYCLEFQSDGRLADVPNEDLDELAAPCLAGVVGTHPPTRAALERTGFLDPDGRLHDWQDYAGALVARRQKDATRKRAKRQMSAGHPADVRRTSEATVQHSTVKTLSLPAGEPSPWGLDRVASPDDEVCACLPSAHQPAYNGFRRAARVPESYAATVRALGPGGAHEAGTWEQVGQALSDLAANGEAFNAHRLRTFVRRLARVEPGRAAGTGKSIAEIAAQEPAA